MSFVQRPVPGSRPSMRRWWLVTGTVALLAIAALIVTYRLAAPDLPDRVASHWGTDGIDATQEPGTFVTTAIAVVAGMTLLMGLLSALIPVDGRRVLGATGAGLAAFFAVGMGGALWSQRGLGDPYDAAGIGGQLALGLAAAIPVAGMAAWLLPTHVPDAPPAGQAAGAAGAAARAAGAQDQTRARDPHAGGGAAAYGLGQLYTAQVPAGTGGYVLIGLVALMAFGLWFTPARWIALVICALVALLLFTMTRAMLVIDDTAVRVISFGRIRWLTAPLRTVSGADADTARPLRDFGGYGLRYAVKGRGFVTQSDPALHLRVPNGADTWITCEDPQLAADIVTRRLGR